MLVSLVPSPTVTRRALYALGLAGFLTAALLIAGPGAWQVWAFFAGPDLALLAGAAHGLHRGQLHPRAVPLYNGLHVFHGPVALGIAAVWLDPAWLAGALAWAAHIAMDRAFGYTLRDRGGFLRVG